MALNSALSDGPLPLEPSPEQIRQWTAAAADLLADYLGKVRERPIYPSTNSRQIRDRLDRTFPVEGTQFEGLLEMVEDVLLPFSRHNAHPRMFGYVQSPGVSIAAIADFLASGVNANLTAWRSAPAAVEIERLTIDWIRQMVGLPENAGGLFVSGGSMANLIAVATARQSRADPHSHGSGGRAPRPGMRLYLSRETHHSIPKAAALLGIGPENVCQIEVDDRCKIKTAQLVRQIEQDLAGGLQPFCLVGNAGTVVTGACDPLPELSEVARRYNLWFHVDASYGGFALLAESGRPLLAGLERADSISLDPHKWLYLPVDCGCVLYRDPAAARSTFAHDADYTRVMNAGSDESFAFWDYGPELSRRFRALKVWMLLRGVGTRQLGAAIEKDIACAHHLETLVKASDDFEMLAPVELSIFCFRYRPPRFKDRLCGPGPDRPAAEAELDALNERLLLELQRDGSSYLSNALIGGRFSLRGCVLNYRTTLQDMETLLADLRRVAVRLA